MTFSGPVAAHAGFLLLVTVPLCWRFRAPVTVVILVTAGVVWILVMFTAQDQPPFEPTLAISCPCSRWPAAPKADGSGWAPRSRGLFPAGEIRSELGGQGIGDVLPAVVFFVLTFVLGRIVHAHRQRASGQQDRAEQLEREQESRAARAVDTERARIARELHDVIAHSLSVIVVQAAAERRVLGRAALHRGNTRVDRGDRAAGHDRTTPPAGPAPQERRRALARSPARPELSATWWPRSARQASR